MLVRRPADIRLKSGADSYRHKTSGSIFSVSRLEMGIWSSPDDRVLRTYILTCILIIP